LTRLSYSDLPVGFRSQDLFPFSTFSDNWFDVPVSIPEPIRLSGLATRLAFCNLLPPRPVCFTGTALLGFAFWRLL